MRLNVQEIEGAKQMWGLERTWWPSFQAHKLRWDFSWQFVATIFFFHFYYCMSVGMVELNVYKCSTTKRCWGVTWLFSLSFHSDEFLTPIIPLWAFKTAFFFLAFLHFLSYSSRGAWLLFWLHQCRKFHYGKNALLWCPW